VLPIRIRQQGNPNYAGKRIRSDLRKPMAQPNRRRSIQNPSLAIVEVKSVLGEGITGRKG